MLIQASLRHLCLFLAVVCYIFFFLKSKKCDGSDFDFDFFRLFLFKTGPSICERVKCFSTRVSLRRVFVVKPRPRTRFL